MPAEPTPAAPAAVPAAAPAAAAPAASPATQPAAAAPARTVPATGKPGTFISNALKMLSGEEPASSPDNPPGDTTTASPEPSPGEAVAPDTDGEDAAAEKDIARETGNMPSAQKAAFTKLRYKLRDVQRQAKVAAEAQAAQGTPVAAAPEVAAEIEQLRAELATKNTKLGEFEKEVFATRLELTDEFRAQVVAPRERVATEISSIAKRYEGVDQDQVVAAVQTGDPDRVSRITADMNDFDRHTFYGLVREFHAINNTENGLRANSKDALEHISMERRTKNESQVASEKADWDRSLGSAWQDLTETFPVLEPIEGDPDWNGKLDTIKSFATSDRFGKLTIKERAEALHRAAAFPVLVGELEASIEELKTAQEKLSKYESASPGVSSSGGVDTGSSAPAGGDFVSNALAALRKAGAR